LAIGYRSLPARPQTRKDSLRPKCEKFEDLPL